MSRRVEASRPARSNSEPVSTLPRVDQRRIADRGSRAWRVPKRRSQHLDLPGRPDVVLVARKEEAARGPPEEPLEVPSGAEAPLTGHDLDGKRGDGRELADDPERVIARAVVPYEQLGWQHVLHREAVEEWPEVELPVVGTKADARRFLAHVAAPPFGSGRRPA